jgi:hypothetical protein
LLGIRVRLDGGDAMDLEIVVAAGGVELGLEVEDDRNP